MAYGLWPVSAIKLEPGQLPLLPVVLEDHRDRFKRSQSIHYVLECQSIYAPGVPVLSKTQITRNCTLGLLPGLLLGTHRHRPPHAPLRLLNSQLIQADHSAMLQQLPPELQRLVVEELRIPRVPVGTERLLLQRDLIEARSALRGLCLTSRVYHDLAEPLLYESIALTKDKQFPLLLNSLLANRDRRSWIRSISCPMCLVWEIDTHAVLPLWNRLVAPRNVAHLDHRERRALRLAGLELEHILGYDHWTDWEGSKAVCCGLGKDEWAFGNQLLAFILCLTTRLEDILLQIPTDKEMHTGLVYITHHLTNALVLGCHYPRPGVLQSLRSVKVQPTRCRVSYGGGAPVRVHPPRTLKAGGPDPGFGIDPLHLVTFEIQNVEQVEFCGDNGVWFRLFKAGRGPWTDDTLPPNLRRFRSLKGLKLYESETAPSFLRHLLEEAHSLETFHYTTRQQEWRRSFRHPEYRNYAFRPEDCFSINEALWPARKAVKELALGSVQRPWADGDEEYRDLELIVVLEAFERLTRLSIDIRWVVPVTLDLDKEVAIVPLYKRLPESIEDITLTETWTRTDLRALSGSRKVEKQAMAWVEAAVWTLLGDDGEIDGEKGMKLARLRKVTLTAVPAFHEYGAWELDPDEEEDSDFEYVPLKTDDGISQMKSLFARRGVGFSIKWISDHSSFSSSGS